MDCFVVFCKDFWGWKVCLFVLEWRMLDVECFIVGFERCFAESLVLVASRVPFVVFAKLCEVFLFLS